MKLRTIIQHLESIAPLSHQESYDNAGLIVGDPEMWIKGAVICLDSTEDVLKEAIELKANLIIAHHPIVFKGLKKFNGRNYVERVVIQAIKHDIAIYAIHTNLDNALHRGVNAKIAEKLELTNLRALAPAANMNKVQFFLNEAQAKRLSRYNFAKNRSFFKSLTVNNNESAIEEPKLKFETVLSKEEIDPFFDQVNHALENTAYDYEVINIQNKNSKVGAGIVGDLRSSILETTFLQRLKKNMQVNTIKHTPLLSQRVQKIAICGGAGGFLLPMAIRSGAQFFVSSDYKYHEFFDADGKIVIADIGHYESEQFTIELIEQLIREKFSNFAAHCTKINTNPVNYY